MEQSRGARLRDRIAAMPFFSAFSVTRVIPIGAVLKREPARAYRVWPVWQQLGAIYGPGRIQYWPTQLPSDDGRGDRSREYSRDRHAGPGFDPGGELGVLSRHYAATVAGIRSGSDDSRYYGGDPDLVGRNALLWRGWGRHQFHH